MRWLTYEHQSGYRVRSQLLRASDESMDALQAGASKLETNAAELKMCKVWAVGVSILVIAAITILWCLLMKKE